MLRASLLWCCKVKLCYCVRRIFRLLHVVVILSCMIQQGSGSRNRVPNCISSFSALSMLHNWPTFRLHEFIGIITFASLVWSEGLNPNHFGWLEIREILWSPSCSDKSPGWREICDLLLIAFPHTNYSVQSPLVDAACTTLIIWLLWCSWSVIHKTNRLPVPLMQAPFWDFLNSFYIFLKITRCWRGIESTLQHRFW